MTGKSFAEIPIATLCISDRRIFASSTSNMHDAINRRRLDMATNELQIENWTEMNRTNRSSILRDARRSRSGQLALYGAAGAVGTACHFAVLLVTVHVLGPVLASTLGAILGCIVNYVLSRQLVFASTTSYARSFPRFVSVAILGIAVNAAIMAAFVDTLPLLLSQALATSTVLLLGYTLNNRWTFDEC